MHRFRSVYSLQAVVAMLRTNPTQLKGLMEVNKTTTLLELNLMLLKCHSPRALRWTQLVFLVTSSKSWLPKLSYRISTVIIRIGSSNSEIIKTIFNHRRDSINSLYPQLPVLGAKVSKEWQPGHQGMVALMRTTRFLQPILEIIIPKS